MKQMNPLTMLRVTRSWTLEDLASRADVSKAALSRIERGERTPSLETLVKLAKTFGLSELSELLAPWLAHESE